MAEPLLTLPIPVFGGLSLKPSVQARQRNTFQQLDNFDLYLPGSLRKVLPAVLYGGPYGAPILNAIEYLAQPNNGSGGIRRLIGIGTDGKLYDLASATPATPYYDTSALLGSPSTVPFVLQMSGYFVPFNMRSWQASTHYNQYDAVLVYSPSDGNVYVFYASVAGTSGTVQPVWPDSGTKVDGGVTWTATGQPNSTRFLANYLVIIVPGKQPIRVVEWAYVPGVTSTQITAGQMGCSAPMMPPQLSGFEDTPNLNGYAPAAGRAYGWTLYNPQTLQESAISPFVGQTKIIETDNANTAVTINGSILLPLPAQVTGQIRSYQSYYVAIPISALTPAIGQGYSCVRIYATKDGGTSLFLVKVLFDNNGNQVTNSDGSIPIALLTALQVSNSWTDYFPVPTAQAAQNSARIYEGSGPINLAPDPVNLGSASWTLIKPASNLMYISPGTAPDGSNSFALDATAGAIWSYKSVGITVLPGTQYAFSGYIDNTNGTGGNIDWKVVTPNGTVLLTCKQADGTAGTVTGTFTTGASVKTVQIEAIIDTGDTLTGTVLWSDPVLEQGASISTVATNYPTLDSALSIPAPTTLDNYPPPVAAMGEVWADTLFLVDNTDQTRIWFSQQGTYELFGANSFVRTTVTKNSDQILEIIKCFDRLLVEKGRSIEQITTIPPQEPVPVDPQHGVLARRAGITWGASVLGLITNGLGQINLAAVLEEDKLSVGMAATLFGDDVKPLIDSINAATLHATNLGPILPCPAILNALDLFMLAYSVGNSYADNVLMYFLGKSRGFSRLTALPNGQDIITLKELQLPAGGTGAFSGAGSGAYYMLALTADSKSYVMFQGTQDGTITATAVTQPLPLPGDVQPDFYNNDKHLDSLYIEGEDLGNFEIYVATEDQLDVNGVPTSYPWGPFTIIDNYVRIGVTAQQFVLKLVHSSASATGVTPVISYLALRFADEGELQ